MNALHARSLAELAPALASGHLRAHELAHALIARIAATDAGVRAWAHVDRSIALDAAARLDDTPVGARGGAFGLPLGVKDIIDTEEWPTELGSPIAAGRHPGEDAACVGRWRAAGGLVLGKTATTEFAYMHPAATANPWNARHTPGGSSSGSAAAVALGQVPAALGTQTNGSIIRPAAYCGVVGFKPTVGLVPFDGVHVFSPTLDTLGTFARSVVDTAIVVHTLAPAMPRGVAASRPPRLAFIHRFPWTAPVEDGGALDHAANHLRRAGADVVAAAMPDALADGRDVHRAIMLSEGARALGSLQSRERARMSATLNAGLDEGRTVSVEAHLHALAARRAMIAAAVSWLADYDALMAPSAPSPAPEGLAATGDPSCCTFASLMGFPAITIPIGHGANGLPVGMQLVARGGEDAALLGVAAWCESRLPRWRGLV
ncbi:MAG: amidase [Betaproteobacteria bacterium PRO3]|nr:amidase [Betaproteobacteria bacterium PRO3]